MANGKVVVDPRDLIKNKMEQEGRMLSWLADKTGINYQTLRSCVYKKYFSLSQENLNKINKALETDYSL